MKKRATGVQSFFKPHQSGVRTAGPKAGFEPASSCPLPGKPSTNSLQRSNSVLRHLFFISWLVKKTEVTDGKGNGARQAGVEPDSLADFTTSLFLP